MASPAFEEAPSHVKDQFKLYRRMEVKSLAQDVDLVDFLTQDAHHHFISEKWPMPQYAFESFLHGIMADLPETCDIYRSQEVPGLCIAPAMLPSTVQVELISRLLHRDLVDPNHQTNLHLHHGLHYPPAGQSFFALPGDAQVATPKDPTAHRPWSVAQVLRKKLRWITLGGQYDWTDKKYPDVEPPPFPTDMCNLIRGIFPEMVPQAAILNLYSPGDTLSMHRDVAESVDQGLVSLSIGCDCIFLISPYKASDTDVHTAAPCLALRLRSGDAVFMTGESRYAWHGVPKIIAGTCPTFLTEWPKEFKHWQGFMDDKRVNLNVRQMR